MLAVSGRLDLSQPVPHPFPDVNSWAFTIHAPFFAVYDHDRRSIYLMLQRTRRHPFLAMFDAADPNVSVDQRLLTTTPTQTLFLMNSPFVQQQADALAQRLLQSGGDDAAKIHLAFEMTHGRAVTESQSGEAVAFLDAYRQKLTVSANAREQAWAGFARVLLTSNAFLYVD